MKKCLILNIVLSIILFLSVDVKGQDINYLNNELFKAICQSRNSDTDKVSSLIRQGANVNFRMKDVPLTLLSCAIANGKSEIVKQLIDNGANIFEENYGSTTLHTLVSAAFFGREEKAWTSEYVKIGKLLIDKGVDVNKENSHGYTPLKTAASLCLPEMVRLFLNNGVNPNVIDSSYKTSLKLAKEKSCSEVEKILSNIRMSRKKK